MVIPSPSPSTSPRARRISQGPTLATTSLGESIFQTLSKIQKTMPLGDVVEADGAETPRPYTSRRRVTSPDGAHPFQPPVVPLPASRSTLRLSRLRPGLGKDEMAQLEDTRPSREVQRATSVRRPGSAGGVSHKQEQPRPGSKGRGRVRASSELTRPAVPLAAILDEPPLPQTWSKSGESALADDSDVDPPTTPSLTTSRTNSDVPQDPRSPLSATPKPSMSNLDSERRRVQSVREHHKYFTHKGPSKDRCHAFSANDAPYPIAYSHKMLDHYNLEVDLSFQTVRGLTFHKLDPPPAKVLDLGCGTGYWIIKAAHIWTHTEFIGFDLVPIQPSLERVTARSGTSAVKDHADLRLHERIRWVHGNFLEKLPFADNEFDFVRCRKIARGVPESKWDELYEHIEEDIIFPTEISNKPAAVAVYPTPSPARTLPPYSSTSHPSSTSLPPLTVRTPDQYRRSPSTSFSSVIESPVEGRNEVPSVSSMSSASLAGSHERRNTLGVPGSATSISNPPIPDSSRDSRGSNDSAGRHHDYAFYDPRAHTRLEELFVAMHDARWINLKPLSLLPRLIQERMTGMIASPPLNMFLPPRPREGNLPDTSVGAIEVARASGEVLIKQLSKMRISGQGPEFDENLLKPQPGDEEIAKYMTFDFTRMGSVAKGGGAGMMPTGQFKFDMGWLAYHLSTAAAEVVACKEAIWEHLRQVDPEADRREFDAMVRQYQADMQDRIGLSSKLRDKLHWGPPESDFMKTAEQRVFDEHYAQAITRDVQQGETSKHPKIMKCFRSFVAFKPVP